MLARKKRKRGRTERRLAKRQAERNRSKTRRKEVLRRGGGGLWPNGGRTKRKRQKPVRRREPLRNIWRNCRRFGGVRNRNASQSCETMYLKAAPIRSSWIAREPCMSVTGRAIVCNGNYCLFVFCPCSVLPWFLLVCVGMISISIYGLESFLLCICRCASSITFLVQQTTSRIGGRSTVAIYGAHDVLKVRNNNNNNNVPKSWRRRWITKLPYSPVSGHCAL